MFGLPDTIAAAIIAALAGFFGAVVNTLLTKGKTRAEIDKLVAETEKIRKETDSMKTTISAVRDQVYRDRIVYDGSPEKISGFDFKDIGVPVFGLGQPGPIGEGLVTLEQGVLNVLRSNKEGAFALVLKKYMRDGKVNEYLPRDVTLNEQRKLLVRCEARASSGVHHLTFSLRTKGGEFVTRTGREPIDQTWKFVERYIRVDQGDDLELRIEDSDVSEAKSSLYLKKIALLEVSAA